MKSLIITLSCFFFMATSIVAQTDQFPKEIVYYPEQKSMEEMTEDEYMEIAHNTTQSFHPIGWSADGKFAYASFHISYHGDLIMILNVQDMISDASLFTEEFSLTDFVNEGDPTKDNVTAEQLWSAMKDKINKALARYKIRQEKKIDYRKETWHRINGQPYKFALTMPADEDGIVQINCRAKGLGEKTIFKGEVDYDSGDYYVAGIIKSPYQDRVAVVCHFIEGGFEGSVVTFPVLVGCNLKNGFK
ncbi:MAG: hypothetical protein GY810_23175 [Aureispira sp.]|nr:hypothetical protein [Aureispira sp.]